MTQIHFLTFGGGPPNMKQAAQRVVAQARNSGFFDSCVSTSEEDLERDRDFQARHGAFVRDNPKGYGQYIWKPYLIGKTLDRLPEGDVLIYCDAGCEINPFA